MNSRQPRRASATVPLPVSADPGSTRTDADKALPRRGSHSLDAIMSVSQAPLVVKSRVDMAGNRTGPAQSVRVR